MLLLAIPSEKERRDGRDVYDLILTALGAGLLSSRVRYVCIPFYTLE